MVVRSLNINEDSFQPQEKDEELLGDKIPYLSSIETLMYLFSKTPPDICFVVSLLVRFSSYPCHIIFHIITLHLHKEMMYFYCSILILC